MSDIIWPAGYVPGFTDNFSSNEVIVAGLTATQVWPFLNEPERWPSYYDNASDVRIHDDEGPELEQGLRFFFKTCRMSGCGACSPGGGPASPRCVAWLVGRRE